jgi:hypothetical protein
MVERRSKVNDPAALPGVIWVVLPPLQEWCRFIETEGRRYANHVALKRRERGWEGFSEALLAETSSRDRRWLPGGYLAVPAEALPRIMARLGENASRITVRSLKAREPSTVPPGGPSGRYAVNCLPWSDWPGRL